MCTFDTKVLQKDVACHEASPDFVRSFTDYLEPIWESIINGYYESSDYQMFSKKYPSVNFGPSMVFFVTCALNSHLLIHNYRLPIHAKVAGRKNLCRKLPPAIPRPPSPNV